MQTVKKQLLDLKDCLCKLFIEKPEKKLQHSHFLLLFIA